MNIKQEYSLADFFFFFLFVFIHKIMLIAIDDVVMMQWVVRGANRIQGATVDERLIQKNLIIK